MWRAAFDVASVLLIVGLSSSHHDRRVAPWGARSGNLWEIQRFSHLTLVQVDQNPDEHSQAPKIPPYIFHKNFMFGSWIEHHQRNNRQSSWIEAFLVSLQELPNYLEIGELNIWYCNIWIRRLLESYNVIFSLDHLPKFPHTRQRRTYGWKHEPCSLWSSGLPKLVCLDPLRGIPCFQTN